MGRVLIKEQQAVALLYNNIGIQRLSDDPVGLLRLEFRLLNRLGRGHLGHRDFRQIHHRLHRLNGLRFRHGLGNRHGNRFFWHRFRFARYRRFRLPCRFFYVRQFIGYRSRGSRGRFCAPNGRHHANAVVHRYVLIKGSLGLPELLPYRRGWLHRTALFQHTGHGAVLLGRDVLIEILLGLYLGPGGFQFHLRAILGAAQCTQNAVVNGVENIPFPQELHLGFRRMDVDIHRSGRHRHMKHADGESAHHDLIFIGFLQRRRHHPGLDITPVHKEVLIASAAPAGGGLSHIAGDGNAAGGGLDLHHFLGAGASHGRINGGEQLAVAGSGQLRLAVPKKTERNLRMAQCLTLNGAADIAALHAVPL